jgi:hypothetical protein
MKKRKEMFAEMIRKSLGRKPTLSYLELHLADHCNMNCKGCGHFAPIAEKKFPDLNQYKCDIRQLQILFATIGTVRLMGGEPLLNSQIEDFLFVTRSTFPKAEILIATNGILLPQMPESFWRTCRENSIGIDITIYPPMKHKESALIQLAKNNGLKIRTHSAAFFHAFYNKKGDTNSEAAFRKCRTKYYTPMLHDGKIYVCSVPATINIFNKKYGLQIPQTGFVDIYAPDISGRQAIKQLNKSATICQYCTIGWEQAPQFQWATSEGLMSEWDAEFAKAENSKVTNK